MESVITFVDSELNDDDFSPQKVVKVKEHLGSRFRNLFEENEKDFNVIHENIDKKAISDMTDGLAGIISSSGLMPEWREKLRQSTKLLARDIRKLMQNCQDEVGTWAKMTAAMSLEWGADAPLVAGVTWIATKTAEFVVNKFQDVDFDAGPVAMQFIEDNITEDIQETLETL